MNHLAVMSLIVMALSLDANASASLKLIDATAEALGIRSSGVRGACGALKRSHCEAQLRGGSVALLPGTPKQIDPTPGEREAEPMTGDEGGLCGGSDGSSGAAALARLGEPLVDLLLNPSARRSF